MQIQKLRTVHSTTQDISGTRTNMEGRGRLQENSPTIQRIELKRVQSEPSPSFESPITLMPSQPVSALENLSWQSFFLYHIEISPPHLLF